MRHKGTKKTVSWGRERWLFLLLALVYLGLFTRGLLFGDVGVGGILGPDGSAVVAQAVPTLHLPTNPPPEATPSQAPRTAVRKLDVNDADAWMLTAIPGVGDALAGRIIEYRDAHGGFVSLEELQRVSGIGDKLYATLVEYLELNIDP